MRGGPSTLPGSGSGLPRVQAPSTGGVLQPARVHPAEHGTCRKSSRFADSVGTNSNNGSGDQGPGTGTGAGLSPWGRGVGEGAGLGLVPGPRSSVPPSGAVHSR